MNTDLSGLAKDHWLDDSNVDKPCVGLTTNGRERWELISKSGHMCPFNIKISCSTAFLMRVTAANADQGIVFHVLRYSSRCVRCDFIRDSGDAVLKKMEGPNCQARGCTNRRWERVGLFCEAHYTAASRCRSLWFERNPIPDIPQELAARVPSLLHKLGHANFSTDHGSLKSAINTLLNPCGPRVFAVDTEFWNLSGRNQITEVAFVNVRTGKVVVHAVFDDHRALEASSKMSFLLRSIDQQAESPPRHIPMVRTVAEMVRQISDCQVRRRDIFIEYSFYRNRTLDIENLRQLLKNHGFKESDILSSRHAYPVGNPIKEQLAKVLQLDCYKLQFLFRCLFPQHPLVDKNHSAAVDSIQLAQIVRLLVELAKRVKDRVLPPGLLQGLDRLPLFEQKNTLDRYMEPVTS